MEEMAMKADSSGREVWVAPEEDSGPLTRQRSLWRVPQLGLLVFAIVLLYWNACPPSHTTTSGRSLYDTTPATIDYARCESIVSSEARTFGFNISDSDGAETHWRLSDSSNSTGRLSGIIHVQRGDVGQTSDIEVRLEINSSSTADYKNVVYNRTATGLSLDYLPSDNDEDICTEIKVMIYFRPESPVRLLDVLEIRSETFDLWVHDWAWQINNLITHTSHGEYTYEGGKGPDPLHPDNIDSSSTTGVIWGWYGCEGRFKIHSKSGQIDLMLVPRYTFIGKPMRPEEIVVYTISGDINVAALWEYWPQQPFTHYTEIHSAYGNVVAEIPHGSYTTLASISGNVKAYLRPFAAVSPDDESTIKTTTLYGNTVLHLDNADRELLDELYDPLLSTKSDHYVGTGDLYLRYPFSWFGKMKAYGKKGSIKLGGSALDEVEEGDRFVKAVRGRGAGSRMEAVVHMRGMMDVTLGIWDTDE
ncbi:uncharacterized protein J4E88_007283 [Alternaria novae-zelandiae]|uniref:uncharacterized protein n=1 Tax=Alternaria novae-zelandiae TaxID=430562 RepID=UPI0020C399F3|nr:uncharacterized protein J4E88_007283 [Alternaria novae-zelandiae]KAI4676368.1 hypothetical protein J4E88_007283 [Alternaria novae-zelandiae]